MQTEQKTCKRCGNKFQGTADDKRCIECDETMARVTELCGKCREEKETNQKYNATR